MTVQGQLFERVAICSARVSANNYFSVSQKDIDSSNLEAGDDVRVRLTKVGEDSGASPLDSDVYDSTLQKSNQVYIPADTRDKLNLETGSIVKYVVIPKKSFPGLQDGPIREKAKDLVGGGSESEGGESERPERQTNNATFSTPMQKTGQVTVPADVMNSMGLLQGDTVLATINWKGDSLNRNKDIGTGNRITISKDEREELGLEPGDEPEVRLAVFD